MFVAPMSFLGVPFHRKMRPDFPNMKHQLLPLASLPVALFLWQANALSAQTPVGKVMLASSGLTPTSLKCEPAAVDSIVQRLEGASGSSSIAEETDRALKRLCSMEIIRQRRGFPTRTPDEVHAYFGDVRHLGGLGQVRVTNGRTILSSEVVNAAIRGIRLSVNTAFATAQDSAESGETATTKASIDRLLATGGNLALQAQVPLLRWASGKQDAEFHLLSGGRVAVDVPSLGGAYTNLPTSQALQADAAFIILPVPSDLRLAFNAHVEGLWQQGFISELKPAGTNGGARRSGATWFLSAQFSVIIEKGLQVGFEFTPMRGDLLEHASRNRLVLSVAF